MILLDTNAILLVLATHARADRMLESRRPLYISPANLLEVQVLLESGRLRLKPNVTPATVAEDDRWHLDDPSASSWFNRAWDLSWTRDPFDRLLVAHALHRGWRFATTDERILQNLRDSERFEL